ncbi:MAG: hypothetical protein V3574_05075 [Candidatus Moraniibacteriota bacterium]
MLKKIKNINKQKKGFSIGEVVLAIFILSVGLLALFSLFNQGIRELQEERDVVVASMLAQEGVELVRNTRDNNWADREYPSNLTSPETFDDKILISTNSKRGNCFLDYIHSEVSDTKCDAGKDATGKYLYLDGLFYSGDHTGIKTKFRRRILFEPDGGTPIKYVKVTSMVDWSNRSDFLNLGNCVLSEKCVFSQSILTDWGTGT